MTTTQIDCLAAGSALHPLYAYFKIKYINRLVYAEITRTGEDGDYNYYHFSYDGPIRPSGETLTSDHSREI